MPYCFSRSSVKFHDPFTSELLKACKTDYLVNRHNMKGTVSKLYVSNNTWIYVYIKKTWLNFNSNSNSNSGEFQLQLQLREFQLQLQLRQVSWISTPTPTPTQRVSTPTPASLLNINSNSNPGGFNSNSNSNSGVGVNPTPTPTSELTPTLLGELCDLDLWPHQWPWPLIFQCQISK